LLQNATAWFCKQGKNPADVIAISPYQANKEATKIRLKERKEFRFKERERLKMEGTLVVSDKKIYKVKTFFIAWASSIINAFIRRDRWPKSKHFFTEAKECEIVNKD